MDSLVSSVVQLQAASSRTNTKARTLIAIIARARTIAAVEVAGVVVSGRMHLE